MSGSPLSIWYTAPGTSRRGRSAVLDALTYVVFSDDSQVVELRASKDYGPPGVVLEVRKVLESGVPPDSE